MVHLFDFEANIFYRSSHASLPLRSFGKSYSDKILTIFKICAQKKERKIGIYSLSNLDRLFGSKTLPSINSQGQMEEKKERRKERRRKIKRKKGRIEEAQKERKEERRRRGTEEKTEERKEEGREERGKERREEGEKRRREEKE